LLAVIQVLARRRYNDPGLLAILGGKQAMIESPLIQEIVSEAVHEACHEAILDFLRTRFGEVPEELEKQIRSVVDRDGLRELTRSAAACADLDGFRKTMA
jgi:hypothetical protein